MTVEEQLNKLVPGFSRIMSKMDDDAKQFAINQFARKSKHTFPALLLWIIGFHYAYYGKWGMQALFIFTAGGIFIWWLVDLFRLSGITARWNEATALEIAQQTRNLHAL